jgi:hypothetical protein
LTVLFFDFGLLACRTVGLMLDGATFGAGGDLGARLIGDGMSAAALIASSLLDLLPLGRSTAYKSSTRRRFAMPFGMGAAEPTSSLLCCPVDVGDGETC